MDRHITRVKYSGKRLVTQAHVLEPRLRPKKELFMKKKSVLLGMLGLLLALSMILAGCPTDSDDDDGGTATDKFTGEGVGMVHAEGATYKLTITMPESTITNITPDSANHGETTDRDDKNAEGVPQYWGPTNSAEGLTKANTAGKNWWTIDKVSGATRSSGGLAGAIADAVEKAYIAKGKKYNAGTFTGTTPSGLYLVSSDAYVSFTASVTIDASGAITAVNLTEGNGGGTFEYGTSKEDLAAAFKTAQSSNPGYTTERNRATTLLAERASATITDPVNTRDTIRTASLAVADALRQAMTW
jgi:major membrane immunogen (membrane-anchored lipoprotein)